jgi:hypothetical protein
MKSVFDMTQGELDKRFRPVIKRLVSEQFEKVGYILYQDEQCGHENVFVREHSDGRKELVRMGDEPLQYGVIREIE